MNAPGAGHEHHEQLAREERHRRSRLVFWGFAAIAAVLLFTEHRAQLLGLLPYLLLLACPLMHLFHHGHGGHHHPRDGTRGAGASERRGEEKP